MRKNFGVKTFMYPQPVLIIATYDENGIADAMNAAWGCIADTNKIALYLSAEHKTVQNILINKAFTVSMANGKHVMEADYVGIVSAHQVYDKIEKAGLHVIKSEFVNAPLIEEFPLAIECQLISFDEDTELLVGEIINVCADESILDENGKIDPILLDPITFDPVHHQYLRLGNKVGNAFQDGLNIKKKYE